MPGHGKEKETSLREREMGDCSDRDQVRREGNEGGKGKDREKDTDTGNLEKEAHHVVERERQQGVRYLNKKRW